MIDRDSDPKSWADAIAHSPDMNTNRCPMEGCPYPEHHRCGRTSLCPGEPCNNSLGDGAECLASPVSDSSFHAEGNN